MTASGRNLADPLAPHRAFAGLFALAAVLAAVVVDLSGAHAEHHADSLIPALASLYHWEPFFWGTDRNGQLLPLLASPVTHPFANLLVQFGLSVFAGVAALGLFARLVAPACWPAAAAGAWALVLFGYTEFVRFNMLNPCQPYAVALCGAGLGLWAARGASRWRWALAAVLFAGVGWVNVGIGMNLGPWLLFGWLLAGRGEGAVVRRADFLRGVGLLAFGTAVGLGLQRLSPHPKTPFNFLHWERWAAGWGALAGDLGYYFGMNFVLSLGLLALGLVWLAVPATRASAGRRMRDGAAALAALEVSLLFVGTTAWAADNAYSARYLFPSLLLLNVAAAGAAVGPPLERLRPARRRAAGIAAVALVAAMPLAVYGWPSVGGARASFDTQAADHARDVLAARCTHVSGDYWDVWPAVFHANLALAERGEDRVVWGVAPRAEPTRPQWSAVPPAEVRLGWLVRPRQTEPTVKSADIWRREFPYLRLAGRAPGLWLYVAPEPARVP